MQDPVKSPAEPSDAPAEATLAATVATVAMGTTELEALERELEAVLAGPSRECLAQPLAAVRMALGAMASDPAAAAGLATALDGLEDVLEALMRATGWPTARGRGEPV